MLSEQDFREWYKNYCKNDHLLPGPTAILEFIKPHLQQPFDREALGNLVTKYLWPEEGSDFDGFIAALHTGGSEPVSCVLPSGAVELLKELAALGSMERALDISSSAIGLSSRANAFGYLWDKPVCGTSKGSGLLANEKVQPLVKGKSYSISGYGPFIAGSESILIRGEIPEVIEIKPVCACGGSGEITGEAPDGSTQPVADCPACKQEVRYHRSGQGMHLDERVKQQRQGKPIFSGDDSVDMWKEINGARTIKDLRRAVYGLGCKLQEFESRVDQRESDRRTP